MRSTLSYPPSCPSNTCFQITLMTVHIGLYNPKNPQNVGAVLRAAGCYQADAVRFTGRRYLLAAEHRHAAVASSTQKKNKRQKTAATDTKKHITEKIRMQQVEDMLQDLSPSDTEIVCVELVVGARPLPEFRHPENALYVFGPEDGQIPQTIVDQAHHVVYVPTVTCMNLAASVNVVLYDRMAKEFCSIWNTTTETTATTKQQEFNHDEWIKKSRDNNNRLRVKKKNIEPIL